MTQTQAGAAVFGTLRTWQDWEAGNRRMHPGLWALYLLRTGQHPAATLKGDLAGS